EAGGVLTEVCLRRTVDDLSRAAVARAVARADVDVAGGTGDGAAFVRARRIDGAEGVGTRSRQQEHAADRLDERGAPDVVERRTGRVDPHGGSSELTAQFGERRGWSAGRVRRPVTAACGRNRRQCGATRSRTELTSGDQCDRV